jgi:hypothetical protein
MKKLASFVLIALSVCCAMTACNGHNDDNNNSCGNPCGNNWNWN